MHIRHRLPLRIFQSVPNLHYMDLAPVPNLHYMDFAPVPNLHYMDLAPVQILIFFNTGAKYLNYYFIKLKYKYLKI